MSQDSSRLSIDGPPFDYAAVPEAVVLITDRRALRFSWRDGGSDEIPAGRLRAVCRCAWCTRARIDGTFAATFESVAIERLDRIGGYAINIAFSDGHARGIYPWPYLRKIAQSDSDAIAVTKTARTIIHDGLS